MSAVVQIRCDCCGERAYAARKGWTLVGGDR